MQEIGRPVGGVDDERYAVTSLGSWEDLFAQNQGIGNVGQQRVGDALFGAQVDVAHEIGARFHLPVDRCQVGGSVANEIGACARGTDASFEQMLRERGAISLRGQSHSL